MTSKNWTCFRKLSLWSEVVERPQKLMLKKILLLRSCHCFVSQVKRLIMSMFTFEQKFNQLLIVQVCIFSELIQWIHAIQDFLKIRINDVSKRADLLIYSKHSSKQQALLHPIFEFSLICTKYDKYFIFWIVQHY